MSADKKDVSVVIGFKDWGLDRLCLAVSTIRDSFGELDGEVIVSDYGSADYTDTKRRLEALGARYVYTETDGVWSRSRALNAGFAVSTGRVLVSTDADMIFSPSSFERIGNLILQDSSLALLLQCRDLPPGWSDERLLEEGLDWARLEGLGRRRARWGMGGMMAVPREAYLRVRGFDERMHTYGSEDIDFVQRVRRAGQRVVWVEEPGVRMYHMWHPSTREAVALSPTDTAQVEVNRRIVREDQTYIRNITEWRHRPADAQPLVTVVIATLNRSGLLRDAIRSVQAQSVQDFEIVVVDDGSSDDTETVVRSFDDGRIRYFRQPSAGIAAARNRGSDEARGQFVAVLDDDDIALPWRLEAHFSALEAGVHGTYGAFVNFSDRTGEMKVYATKRFTPEIAADKGGAPGHSTWMVETELLRTLRYDEQLTSGIDNDLALRMLRSGARWSHAGKIMTLRRMHGGQVTVLDGEAQIGAARDAYQRLTFVATDWTLKKLRKDRGNEDYVPVKFADNLSKVLTPFLPDHLARRTLMVVDSSESSATARPGTTEFLQITDATWDDLVAHREHLGPPNLRAVLRSVDSPLGTDDSGAALEMLRAVFQQRVWAEHPSAVVVQRLGRDLEELRSMVKPMQGRLRSSSGTYVDVELSALPSLADGFRAVETTSADEADLFVRTRPEDLEWARAVAEARA